MPTFPLAGPARFPAAHPAPAVARAARAFREAVLASPALRYGGEPLEAAFEPVVFAADELARTAFAVEGAIALLERATRAYLDDEAVRAFLGHGPAQVALVRHDPGYARAIPIARLDSHPGRDGRPVFIEANTDGTSGMSYVDAVSELFLASAALEAVALPEGLRPFDLKERVLETLLACWAEWRETRPRAAGPKPPALPRRVAIVDWRGVATEPEFQTLASFFRERRGLDVAVADPRDLVYDGRELRAGGTGDAPGDAPPIDLVYRRVVSTEYAAAPPEATAALTRAYLDGRVCLVGSFRSDVAFSKKALALVQDPSFGRHFDAADRELAAALFPRTYALAAAPADALAEARSAPERFVLKPSNLYAGRGVVLGAEAGAAAFREAIERAHAAEAHGFVLQERVPPAEIDAPGLRLSGRRYLSLGYYAFSGRLAGVLARASKDLVLAARSDEVLLPVFTTSATTFTLP